MAQIPDESELFQSVWVGNSLLGKQRVESIAPLGGIAARRIEGELYGLQRGDCVQRMLEWIELVKLLWTEDNVSYECRHYTCEGITVEPKPAAKPRPPIWIASNPPPGDEEAIRVTLRRVVNHADGWETPVWDPADVGWRILGLRRLAEEAGRDPSSIETHLYHNINVNEDRRAAPEESKRVLDTYYTMDYPPSFVDVWTATGSPADRIEHLRVYKEMGFDEVMLQMTGWDQFGQLTA